MRRKTYSQYLMDASLFSYRNNNFALSFYVHQIEQYEKRQDMLQEGLNKWKEKNC